MGLKTTDENRLTILYPKIAKEWHPTKNGNLSADMVSYASHKKVWWICNKGHEWESIISNRTRLGRNCPYCTHQKVIVGETDFASVCPAAAKDWDYSKNDNVTPDMVMYGTHKRIWWKCSKCGYEWIATVKERYYGAGCPKCNAKNTRLTIVGVNDLETKRKDLVKYWNYQKNYPLTPKDVQCGNQKKVWWTCKNGHEYQMTIYNKVKGVGCPVCSSRRKTSLPEQIVLYYVKQVFPNAINSYKKPFEKNMELDIYIPELKTGIEYDGKIYHSSETSQKRDLRKYTICKANGIKLIRITNNTMGDIKNCDEQINVDKSTNSNLESAIVKLLAILGNTTNIDINIARDKLDILTCFDSIDISLESEYPDIAKDFNYEKNIGLFPSYFHPGSNERIWWKCHKCGYEWMAMVKSRTHDGDGCKKCASIRGGQKKTALYLKKNGPVSITNPELLNFWNYKKNNILPSEIIAGSTKKVWWICKEGHEWQSALDHVSKRGVTCPYCNNRKILTGYNDLLTKNPTLAAEWDYQKNINLNPALIGSGTAQKAWWLCEKCGYSWCASICSRNKGVGCPNCDNLRKRGNEYAKKKTC